MVTLFHFIECVVDQNIIWWYVVNKINFDDVFRTKPYFDGVL
jgi:hypothetical protein